VFFLFSSLAKPPTCSPPSTSEPSSPSAPGAFRSLLDDAREKTGAHTLVTRPSRSFAECSPGQLTLGLMATSPADCDAPPWRMAALPMRKNNDDAISPA